MTIELRPRLDALGRRPQPQATPRLMAAATIERLRVGEGARQIVDENALRSLGDRRIRFQESPNDSRRMPQAQRNARASAQPRPGNGGCLHPAAPGARRSAGVDRLSGPAFRSTCYLRELLRSLATAFALRSGGGFPEVLADLEAHRRGRRDLQGFAGAQVAAAPGAALIDFEPAEAHQVHRLTLADGALDFGRARRARWPRPRSSAARCRLPRLRSNLREARRPPVIDPSSRR